MRVADDMYASRAEKRQVDISFDRYTEGLSLIFILWVALESISWCFPQAHEAVSVSGAYYMNPQWYGPTAQSLPIQWSLHEVVVRIVRLQRTTSVS